MPKKPLILPIFAVALTALSAHGFDDNDFQIWTDFDIKGPITKTVSVRMEHEMHFVDDADRLAYQHADLGLLWAASSQWILGANMREVFFRIDDSWIREDRPHVNLTYKGQVSDYTWSNRARLELRIFGDRSDIGRFRNKIGIAGPWQWTALHLQPYVAYELFVDSSNGDLNQNRAFAGLKVKLNDHIKGDVGYIWQRLSAGAVERNAHIASIRLSAAF